MQWHIKKKTKICSFLRRCDFYILILLITTFLTPSICFSDANKIFKENSKAVVVIVTYDAEGNPISQGSGFVVRSDGAIVTNYHVISNAENIKIKIGDKVLKVEGLLHIDKENDIVILKAKAKKLPIVKIEDNEKAEVGDRVYVIGSPQGLENTVSEGVLSGIREIQPRRKILQITAPVSSGSSGSPVFNSKGQVSGVATFLIQGGQNLNFAMPIKLVKDKISTKKVIALKEADIEDYKKTAEYWFSLGYYYGQAGLFTEAIEAFKHAISIKPDDAEAHYNLGVVYGKLGMYGEAKEAYKQAIRIKPDDADAHNNLCIVYSVSHMYKEAIEACKQAIQLKPDRTNAHFVLGLIYVDLNYRGSALEQYKILKDLNPELANKLFNLIYK